MPNQFRGECYAAFCVCRGETLDQVRGGCPTSLLVDEKVGDRLGHVLGCATLGRLAEESTPPFA